MNTLGNTLYDMCNLKGAYHAKCTFVRLLYMNMCPRCSSELTNGAVPLQRGARFKRAVSCRARFWLRFH